MRSLSLEEIACKAQKRIIRLRKEWDNTGGLIHLFIHSYFHHKHLLHAQRKKQAQRPEPCLLKFRLMLIRWTVHWLLIQSCPEEEAWITGGLYRLRPTENSLTESFGPFWEAVDHFRDVILLDKCKDNVSELDSFWLSSSLFQGVFAVMYSQRLGYRVIWPSEQCGWGAVESNPQASHPEPAAAAYRTLGLRRNVSQGPISSSKMRVRWRLFWEVGDEYRGFKKQCLVA